MFKEIPASKKSLAYRKLVFGVGNNDAKYNITIIVNDKEFRCPYYRRWLDMLRRCYDPKAINKRPTYKDCLVTPEWLLFSNFKKWMLKQDWKNKDLDKDLLIKNNKIYSSYTCMFIPQEVNKVLLSRDNDRGKYPKGVCWHKGKSKFTASISINSKRKSLGSFKTVYHANKAYQKARKDYIKDMAKKYEDNVKLSSALMQYV